MTVELVVRLINTSGGIEELQSVLQILKKIGQAIAQSPKIYFIPLLPVR
jgi:hypothetical protein